MNKNSLAIHRSMHLVLLVTTGITDAALAEDPLRSWSDTATKSAIVEFVESVTDEASSAFVPVAERIAVFDNDGTLWSEQPAYFQLFYAIDYIRKHADEHPEWRTTQPFKAAIDGDLQTLAAGGEEGLVKLMMASHAGMTNDEFDQSVADFIRSATHPTKKKLYIELVLPADAGVARLPARQRLPDLDRLRRRHRFHARLHRRDLRYPAGTGGRQPDRNGFRDARRQSRHRPPAEDQFHRRQVRQARGHRAAHRPQTHRGVRQLRRRPADAAIHLHRPSGHPVPHRAPHGCHARMGL